MTSKWIPIFSLFICTQVFAFGGNELGNGGDVFYCLNPAGGARAEMVDIYEARLAGRELDLGPAGLSYREKIRYVLEKWSKISPLRTKRYSEWLDAFDSESRMISGVTLPNVSDEGIVAIPKGCEIQQIAIQLADEDLGTNYKRYTINKDLWDLMNEDSRAAMILHELIFREAILAMNRASMRVRYLNGILISSSTVDEYFEASSQLSGLFLEWEWGGYERYQAEGPVFIGSSYSESKVNLAYPAAIRFWIQSEGARGHSVDQDAQFCKLPVSLDRKDGSSLLSIFNSDCQFEGRISLLPRNGELMLGSGPGLDAFWLKGQRSTLALEGSHFPSDSRNVHYRGIDADSIGTRNYRYAEWNRSAN